MQLARDRAEKVDDSASLESVLADFADLLYRQGRHAEAEPVYRELVERRRSHLPASDENVVGPKASLARVLADLAWAARTNAVAANARRLTSKSDAQVANTETNQNLLTSAAMPPLELALEAERLLRECLSARESDTNTTHGQLGDTTSRLGAALLSVAFNDAALSDGRREEQLIKAEAVLLAGQELLQKSRSAGVRYRRDSLERLVRFYAASARPDQGAEWQRKLEAFDSAEAEKKAASASNREAPR
jgi:hypothetical protein